MVSVVMIEMVAREPSRTKLDYKSTARTNIYMWLCRDVYTRARESGKWDLIFARKDRAVRRLMVGIAAL